MRFLFVGPRICLDLLSASFSAILRTLHSLSHAGHLDPEHQAEDVSVGVAVQEPVPFEEAQHTGDHDRRQAVDEVAGDHVVIGMLPGVVLLHRVLLPLEEQLDEPSGLVGLVRRSAFHVRVGLEDDGPEV